MILAQMTLLLIRLDHPPREKEGKTSMAGNLGEGRSIQGSWFIDTQQLGWEKLMLWLIAPILWGWRVLVAVGSLVLDLYLIASSIERGKAHSLKGKWPVEKEKQPKNDKKA